MRKRYVAPNADIVLLETEQNIMEDWGSATDKWTEAIDPRYSVYGTPGGTVVNNNGAPTFVPGGNGGGGRQTPLG